MEQLMAFADSTTAKRLLGLVKNKLSNWEGIVLAEDPNGIGLVAGNRGLFKRKTGFVIAERFRPGDNAMIYQHELNWGAPRIGAITDIEDSARTAIAQLEEHGVIAKVSLLYGKFG